MTLQLEISASHALARPCPWRDLEDLQPLVRSFLRQKLRDENDVEDIVQECLLRAARHRALEGEPDKLSSWMLRIAENALVDHRRRSRRAPVLESEADVLDRFEGRELTPGEERDEQRVSLGTRVLERDDLFACMARSLRSMALGDQAVLERYYAGGGDCEELARVAAVAPTRIKSRLFRARRRLSRLVLRRLPELDEGPSAKPADVAELEKVHARGARCSAGVRVRRRGAAGARRGEGA